jgi:hypothetical protein
VPRQTAHHLKGDRAERAGKYLLLIELESPERRDQIFPSEGVIGEDVLQLVGSVDPVFERLNGFIENFPDPNIPTM